MQKIVFNGHYLMYFDTAVAGYWRALALPYHETMAQLRGDLYVRKATLEYQGSARYDDLLDVGIRCARIGNSSMLFAGRGVPRRAAAGARRAGLCVRRPGRRRPPGRCRPRCATCCTASKPAQPMVDVRVGDWADARPRRARDPQRGVRARSRASRPSWNATPPTRRRCTRWPSTASACRWPPAGCWTHGPGVAKIGRMAVRPALRGAGIGRAVLDALMRGGARSAATARCCCTPRPARWASMPRAGFTPRGAGLRARPASRTRRWCARSAETVDLDARHLRPRPSASARSAPGAGWRRGPRRRIAARSPAR